MENSFLNQLNNTLVQALNENVAFILNQEDTFLPPITNPIAGVPITDANYFNLMLSNGLNGTNFTEFVNMGEALSSGVEWLSHLSPDSKLRGIACQEEGMSPNPRYSFMMPAAQLNQDMLNERRQDSVQNNCVPFQSSNASLSDFGNFLQEQCANALNAALTGCPFKSNIPENAVDQFKEKLIDAISQNPSFMATAANRAGQEVMGLHHPPFDRDNFIEKARDVNSDEFKQLSSAITGHVNDMFQNGKVSFNPGFNDLVQPLLGNNGGKEITGFINDMLKKDGPAAILADTCMGTFIEKAKDLVQGDKRVSAGLALACSVIEPVLSQNFKSDDIIKIADNIAALQELKGDNNLAKSRDSGDTGSFHKGLETIIRNAPQVISSAISMFTGNNHQQPQTQSSSMGRR